MFYVHGGVLSFIIGEYNFEICNIHIVITSFSHNIIYSCGHVPLDVIIQRYLRQHVIKKAFTDNIHDQVDKVEFARDDFLRLRTTDYEYWLLNKEWSVLPTIQMTKKYGPVVLTCRWHNKGNKKMMIHPPRLPKHILPSRYSDQLAHAVIQCRTVKPMRKTKYSTQFELFEQSGTFNGIDTFGLTDFQNMEISSELLSHYESLAIYHRRDTNALLSKLAEEKKIGKCVVNDRRKEATYRVEKLNMNLDDLVFGATYVPIEATIKYVKDQSNSQRYRSFTTPTDQPNRAVTSFRPIWPLHLYPCQKMDGYGARFSTIPNLSPKKTADADLMDNPTAMTLWTTLAMLAHVDAIWDTMLTVELCTSRWEGWLLNFCQGTAFHHNL